MKKPARARPPRGPGRPANPISRDELLAVARQAFSSTGYAGTSMDELARQAGLRKASLFHHFPSKESIYRECVERVLLELAAIVNQSWLAEGAFEERLDGLVDAVTVYLGHHPGAARLLLREVLDGGPTARDLERGPLKALFEQLCQFLRAGLGASKATPAQTRQLALSMLCMNITYFAADRTAELLVGGSVYDAARVKERSRDLVAQTRRLCGLKTSSTDAGGKHR
jgi:TetR/AcrR family transcriptional regulator